MNELLIYSCRKEFYVEMACNGLFGAGIGSQIGPADPNRKYKLQTCEIAVVDTDVRQLLIDFDVMIQLIKVHKHFSQTFLMFINF